MKTAIYIEDGIVQLVITPESEFEKNALRSFEEKPLSVKIFDGAFYDCRGGWTRQSTHYPMAGEFASDSGDRSLILRIVDETEEVGIRMEAAKGCACREPHLMLIHTRERCYVPPKK